MTRKPKLGQNFLIDAGAASAIAAALGDLSGETVLEIGPGKGAITELLAPRAHRLIAVELDRELGPSLREHFRDTPSVTVLQQDILHVDLAALAPLGGTLQILGNLPYYITSDILLYLFAHHAHIARAVLMMQREVADRVAALPGTSDYGLLSATAQLHARVERLQTLPPSAFAPPPDVHSTVVRLTMQPRWQALGVDPQPFIEFLRQGFAQKRKTLFNNLRNAGYDPSQIMGALESGGAGSQARAESLSLEQAARIFSALCSGGRP